MISCCSEGVNSTSIRCTFRSVGRVEKLTSVKAILSDPINKIISLTLTFKLNCQKFKNTQHSTKKFLSVECA